MFQVYLDEELLGVFDYYLLNGVNSIYALEHALQNSSYSYSKCDDKDEYYITHTVGGGFYFVLIYEVDENGVAIWHH